jgi:hypothetical protein
LGTTFWGKVDEDEGAAREASLCETRNFFGEMMELGAWYVRIPDDRRGCLELLENIRANQRRRLKAQEEMENDDDIKRTSASETLRTAQETVSGFDRQLQVLWMRVSGHAYVAAIISMDYLFFAFRQLLVYGQDMYRQAQVWWRQLSDWKTVRDMAFQTSPALTTLIGRADSLQKQLRQLESNDPIAMERKRQKREMALEKWRQAKVEAEARWETAHLAWERRAEEALRDYDRSSSFLGMPMKEGHFVRASSCTTLAMWLLTYTGHTDDSVLLQPTQLRRIIVERSI